MLYAAVGSKTTDLSHQDIRDILFSVLDRIPQKENTLIIPPDFTRHHSRAGEITELTWQKLGSRVKKVIPALGTHTPMSEKEKQKMFGDLPGHLITDHNWKDELIELGRVDTAFIEEISQGRLSFDWPVEINRTMVDEPWDLILSIGQVVPHVIAGMANYSKNIVIGVGGKEAIDKSHFLGAVCGMEGIMGRTNTPVRQLFNRGVDQFCRNLPILYVLTVITSDSSGNPVTRGIFIGDDEECYRKAAELSRQVNITLLDRAPSKILVSLKEEGFRSTWLANKGIYRTRMALADQGELIILAPEVHSFGESERIDRIIRKFGYKGTDHTLKMVEEDPELAENLSAAAHLIHGSTDDRFRVTYCPGGLGREDIEQIGYAYGDLEEYRSRYRPETLKEGWNILPGGEEIFYVSNPSLGLWALEEKFR